MDKLRVGVIGLGRLGINHARVYSELKEVELVGVCDTKKKRAKKVARKYHTTYYTDYHKLLEGLDAVSVVVPTNLHYRIAKDFLKNNINVLVEKPVTKTLMEADELLNIAENRDLILQVGHIERFNSAVRTVEALSQGPQFIECHRLGPYDKRVADIGVVLDLMIHDIDIVLGLVKSEVETIDAIGVSVLSNFEDIANARIKFRNQTICNITASRLTKNVMRKIRIFQKDTYISLDYANQSAHLYRKVNKKIIKEKINIKREDSLKLELKSFINCVQTHQAPLVSGKEGREALKIALEIVERIGKTAS